MKAQFFIFAMVSLMSDLGAAAVTCQSILEEGYPLSSITIDSKKEPTSDAYYPEEHRQNFWAVHERFGFLSDDGKTVVLAQNQTLLKKILQNLKDAKVSLDGDKTATAAKIAITKNTSPEIGEGQGVKADVTSLIPQRFQGLNEFYPSKNGPNCWNLALYFNHVSFSLHETSPQEFKFLMNSVLAKTLTAADAVKPGDVMVFRNGEDEVHAAVFLSPDLVLSKNGTEESKPYRVMDLNEVGAMYSNVHPFWGTKLSDHWLMVRLESLENYVKENQTKMSAVTLAAYKDVQALEAKIKTSTLPSAKEPLTRQAAKALIAAVKQKHQAVLETEKSAEGTKTKGENIFLASALLLRLESLSLY